MSRGVVRKVLRGQRSDVFRVRENSLELYLPWLDAQWAAGQHNGAELWRCLQSHGFRGCPIGPPCAGLDRRHRGQAAVPVGPPRYGQVRVGCEPLEPGSEHLVAAVVAVII